MTGMILTQDLPLNGVQVSDQLNRPGSISATLPKSSSFATDELLDEGRRAIYWERDGKIELGGRLVTARIGLGSSQINIEVEGWLGYWDHRDIWRDRSFTNTEQFDIFKTLVDDAQDEGYDTALGGPGADADLGIEVVWDAASGVLRDRTEDYRSAKAANLGESLRRLAGVGEGFDYGMTYAVNATTNRIDKAIKLWHPRRGRDTGFLFEFEASASDERPTPVTEGGEILTEDGEVVTEGTHPVASPGQRGNITRWGITRDASKMAWRARGWGNGYDADRLLSTQITEARRGAYPPLDVAFTEFSSVEVQATLDENTAAALSRVDHPTRLPVIEINPDAYPRWGDWELGDTVRLRIDDGYGSIGQDVPVTARIAGYSVAPRTNRPQLLLEVA